MKVQGTAQKIRYYYGIVLGAFTVVIGLLFIIQAATIYYAGGETPYSREIAGEKLMQILVPVILWIIAVIAGFVLAVLFPYRDGRPSKPNPRKALSRLRGRMPKGEGEAFLGERARFKRFEVTRLVIWSFAAAFALASAIVSIVYLANTAHFAGADLNGEVLRMLKNVMPWVGASFLLFVGAVIYEHFSAKRELDSMKKLLVLGRGYPLEGNWVLSAKYAVDKATSQPWTKWFKLGVRLAVLAVAVTFIGVGIWNGGMYDVLAKAVMICTECIGLG